MIAICVSLTLARPGVADPGADFQTAFAAYKDAMERSHYVEAVAHAEKARALAKEVYPDDERVWATLAYNHGEALAKMRANRQAHSVLKEARKLARRAHGPDSAQVFRVEMMLLNTAPDDAVRAQLTRVLKLARQHLAEDSEAIAELKLIGGMRVWWDRRSADLLGEAAETFARLGKTDREGLARFWIGKIHFGRNRYRDAAETMTTVVELLPDDDRIALMARANLVEAYEELGDSDRATEHCLAIGRITPWTGTAEYQPLFKRPPTYPRSALVRSTEGHVVLEFTVDEMGFVRDPQVVESRTVGTRSGVAREFEHAAIEAARKFRYAPKFVDGQAVAVERVRNRIVYKMRN